MTALDVDRSAGLPVREADPSDPLRQPIQVRIVAPSVRVPAFTAVAGEVVTVHSARGLNMVALEQAEPVGPAPAWWAAALLRRRDEVAERRRGRAESQPPPPPTPAPSRADARARAALEGIGPDALHRRHEG